MSQMKELKREIQEAMKLHLSLRTRLLIFYWRANDFYVRSLWTIRVGVALDDYYWCVWLSDPFQMETEAARVVLDYHDSRRGASTRRIQTIRQKSTVAMTVIAMAVLVAHHLPLIFLVGGIGGDTIHQSIAGAHY